MASLVTDIDGPDGVARIPFVCYCRPGCRWQWMGWRGRCTSILTGRRQHSMSSTGPGATSASRSTARGSHHAQGSFSTGSSGSLGPAVDG